jgi:hypothetical protein
MVMRKIKAKTVVLALGLVSSYLGVQVWQHAVLSTSVLLAAPTTPTTFDTTPRPRGDSSSPLDSSGPRKAGSAISSKQLAAASKQPKAQRNESNSPSNKSTHNEPPQPQRTPAVTFNVTRLRSRPGWPTWTEKFLYYPDEDELLANYSSGGNSSNNNNSSTMPLLPLRRVCFVHVGKTAGSTLACHLGFQYPACGTRNVPVVPGSLARHTTNIMHSMYDSCSRRVSTLPAETSPPNGMVEQQPHDWYYLFAVRHPLARLQSWFAYERPYTRDSPQYKVKKPLFIDCHYTSLEQLGLALTHVIDYLLNSTHSNASQSAMPSVCARRAWQAVTGQVGYSRHNHFNYGYYYRHMAYQLDNAPTTRQNVLVIRTEHLATDYNAIQVQLWRNAPLSTSQQDDYFTPRANPSLQWVINGTLSSDQDNDRTLSPVARFNLCWALCHEIVTYQTLLDQAQNLLPHQRAESRAELLVTCPHHSTLCPAVDWSWNGGHAMDT